VHVPPGQHAPWQAFIEQGWNAVTAPEAYGGQGLALPSAAAAQMLFDAANIGLGMLALNQRCAVRLILKTGTPAQQALWIPRFISGEWAATICISEPDAGSDAGRIRTRAVPTEDGMARITGEKCWISFGDQNLCPHTVHFILARSPGLPPGAKGLTLFLLPDEDAEGGRNGITVLRIEEKLGLHASPTCGLAFENSLAEPLSAPGRGLASLYEMIAVMRLGVAVQGTSFARQAARIASRYAFERKQGGPAEAPPIEIHHHAEVRRLLLAMQLTAASVSALTLQAAAWIEAGDQGDAAAAARAAVLLPVVKVLGAEAAFNNADRGIQVLGGAGFTKDWPLERLLRDSRIFSIYEGTTAIQALDLTFRHVLGANKAAAAQVLNAFRPDPALRARLDAVIAYVTKQNRATQERAALPLLRLFGLVCTDGVLRRHTTPYFRALLAVHEANLAAETEFLLAQCMAPDLSGPFTTIFAA
jgi:alkylation response protein AidB-like acyl-CoA dehydrogenase